tara:strand:+ start:2064 stop:2906 length:843 start_codon:yes stop_codon:yes gene_type:complete
VISCKQLFALFLILVLDINANENIIDEYKVEIIVFKFKNIETNENFVNELNLPNRNVINLVEPKLFLNKDALSNFPKNNSFFSNLLKNINPVKNQQTSSNEEIKTIINPKNWYRESSEIDKLSKLYKNIKLNNQLIYLDSKSWIQSIDDENKSKYVFIENHDKEFGFFLKLYKKRFLHLDLKAYLGINGEQKIESTQNYIKNYESIINNSGEADQELEIDIYLPKKFESIEISNKAYEKTQNKEATILNKFIDIDKRIFNEEIHLFDHPYFGVIVSVSKI